MGGVLRLTSLLHQENAPRVSITSFLKEPRFQGQLSVNYALTFAPISRILLAECSPQPCLYVECLAHHSLPLNMSKVALKSHNISRSQIPVI